MPNAPSQSKKNTASSKLNISKLRTQPRSSPSFLRSSSAGKKRHNTIYDAVAGRITTEGLLQGPRHSLGYEDDEQDHSCSRNLQFKPSKYRDTLSRSTQPFTADEALFQRQRAPTRIHEDDIYTAHRHLLGESDVESQVAKGPDDEGGSKNLGMREIRQLPRSDLLKSMHAYVSDFYATLAPSCITVNNMDSRRGREESIGPMGKISRGKTRGDDYFSFDETALIAIGVLVEEMAAEVLGETGDVVFIEGVEDEQKAPTEHDRGDEIIDQSNATVPEGRRWGSGMNTGSVIARNTAAVKSGQTTSRKGRKVRKLDHEVSKGRGA